MEIWDPVHWYCPGAGERDDVGRTYSLGELPAPYKGDHFCGDPSWFQGTPSDAPDLPVNSLGLPSCCFDQGAYSSAYSGSWNVFFGR
jgi:hypothetical protein